MVTPTTQFVEVDGGSVAYQVIGDGDVDLVLTAGSFSNIDFWWDDPSSASFLRSLARFSRLIIFDRRGVGASDPPADGDWSWRRWHRDLESVVDATSCDDIAIFAALDGTALALPFAAAHPERISHLVLYNATARFLADGEYLAGHDHPEGRAVMRAVRETWGRETAAPLHLPPDRTDADFSQWYARFQRSAMTQGAIEATSQQILSLDVRDTLPAIRADTLVLHRGSHGPVPAAQGRHLADHIAGARFTEIPGTGTIVAADDLDVIAQLTERHVRGTGDASRAGHRRLAAVVYVDIVGSTQRVSDIGDRSWNDLLDLHDSVVERHIRGFGGDLVKFLGDGCLATFDSPQRAVTCALALIEALEQRSITACSGVHVGEIEHRDGQEIGGLAVHVGARVAAVAAPGQVAVTSIVRDLVTDPSLRFSAPETRSFKGVAEPVITYTATAT